MKKTTHVGEVQDRMESQLSFVGFLDLITGCYKK
jgi:hypothetical protein